MPALAARVILVAAAYVAAAMFSRLVALGPNHAAIWIPAGVALAAVLLAGPRLWAGIALGAFVTSALGGTPLWAAGWAAATYTLEALLGASLLRRAGFDPALERFRDVGALVALAAGLAAALGSGIRATGLWLGGAIGTAPGAGLGATLGDGSWGSVWLGAWLPCATGVLVVVPVALTWSSPSGDRVTRRRVGEAAIVGALLVAGAGAAFGQVGARHAYPVAYILLPLLWAAFRFGPRGAAVATVAISTVAVTATAHGLGPFARWSVAENVALVQTYLGVVGLTGLVVAALVAAYNRTIRQERARSRQLEALRAVGVDLTRETDLERLLHLIIERASALFGASSGIVWLWDESAGVLVPRAWSGLGERWSGSRLGPGEGLSGTVAERRESMLVNDYPASPYALGKATASAVRAALAAPMTDQGRLLGALVLAKRDGEGEFAEADRETLSLFAVPAALAIEKTRLWDEADLRRREAELIAELVRNVNEALDLDAVLQRVTDGARDLCRCDMARIALRDHDSDTMVFRYSVGSRFDGYGSVRVQRGVGLGGRAWVTGRPVRIEDRRADPTLAGDHRLVVTEEGIVTELVVSITINARVAGLLYVDNRSPRAFTDRDEAILVRLAEHAAGAIRNAQLYAASQSRGERLATLTDVTRELARGRDLPAVLESIVTSAATIFGGDADLRLLEGDTLIRAAATPGAREFMRDEPVPVGSRMVSAMVARSGEALVVADTTSDARIGPESPVRARPDRAGALMGLPVRLGGLVLGTLTVFRGRGHVFDEDDVSLGRSLADAAAVAIENARLFAETERRRRTAESLADLQRLISASLDPDVIARQAVESVSRLLSAHHAALYELDPASGNLGLLAASGAGSAVHARREVHPKGTGLSGLALREGRPVVTHDVLGDLRIHLTPERRTRLEHAPVRTGLAIPLLLQNQVIGALAVLDRLGRTFTEEDVRLATAFGSQVTVALQHARLFEDNRRRLDELAVLHEISCAVTGQLDRAALVTATRRQIERVFDVEDIVLLLRDHPAGDVELALHVQNGRARPGVTQRRPVSSLGLLASVLETGRPILTDDWIGESRRRGIGPIEVLATPPHLVAVPLRTGNRTLGALALASGIHRFTEAEARLLENIASLLALAFRSAEFYEDSLRAYREVEAAQARVVQNERLRALGEMAAGVAHDFNNTLAGIAIRTDLALMDGDDPAVRRHLEIIQRAALDGERTVRRIQEFTRVRRARPLQAVDLDQLAGEVVELTRPRWRDQAHAAGVGYEVTVEGGEVPPVPGDASELREALINLVFNALDAMPAGGRLTFRTGAEGARAFCAVTDTGIGMPEEALTRVFEPFFTTKSEKGSGLGLSVVYGIVTRHGGQIDVASQLGKGSTFTVWLPAGASIEEIEPPAAPATAGRGRILVVDDEVAVREALQDILARRHDAVGCADGPSALAAFEQGGFDLVITDLGMPGMSGWELAAQIKAASPETPVLLVTGWGDQIDAEEARAKGIDAVLAKPFTRRDLEATIDRLLSSG